MHDDFLHFLQKSPTVWHAAKEISNRLAEDDFSPLSERERWKLEPDQRYFVERDGTLLCAFRLPKKKPTNAILLASHTDSPGLKLKPQPDLCTKEISQLSTEVYGGPLLHSWLDRDLALAGRLETDGGSKLIFLDDMPLIIPQLAIHLDKSINEKGIFVHRQDHLKPILSIRGEETLEKVLKKRFSFKKLYSFDLFLVPLEKAGILGDLVAGYRLDNLSSAYACLNALLKAKGSSHAIQMAVFWDHEEIGSMSATGADSLFVDQVLERISLALNMDREDFHCLKSHSQILSADVTHAWNPNFADKYDPQNSPLMGRGPVLKFNAARKYASDAGSAADVVKIADQCGVPVQKAANRSDIPSGSTVGPIMSANTGIRTLDIGIPCWAMHSTREIIAASDLRDLTTLLRTTLETWTPS
ncbi:MAG: M18 family aminopeptidase [Verrucomicrobiota bacterium]|nr:M18 family aminopeptidase [Verrucomicrobiota bacterium]